MVKSLTDDLVGSVGEPGNRNWGISLGNVYIASEDHCWCNVQQQRQSQR